MKRRVFEVLEERSAEDRVGQVVGVFIALLIVLNIAALIVGTVQSLPERADDYLFMFEAASMVVFTVEYVGRVWSCTTDPRYSRSFWGRVRFILTPLALIDLAVILPFYAVTLVGYGVVDLRQLRSLRALWLLARAARLSKYSRGIRTLSAAVNSRSQELLTIVGLLLVLLVVASTLIFFAETKAQPENFSSIPAAMWWSIITLTTVGYGDVAPVTNLGRVIAGVIAVLGIALFAVPAGILGSSFVEQMQRQRSAMPRVCPHCGGEILEEGRPGDSTHG